MTTKPVYWQEVINISHLHRLYAEDKIALPQMAKAVVAKLKMLKAYAIADIELVNIMDEFDALDYFSSLKDYETVLDMLYDYGDKNCKLWIEAMTPAGFGDDIPSYKRTPFEHEHTPKVINNFHHRQHGPWVAHKHSQPSPVLNEDSICKHCFLELRKHRPGFTSCSRFVPFISTSIIADTTSKTPPKKQVKYAATVEHEKIGRTYSSGRTWNYMAKEDFEKKLATIDVNPDEVSEALYDYIKGVAGSYQEWLLDKLARHNLILHEPKAI